MKRSRHPKKEVEQAVRYAEDHGWPIEVGGGHRMGSNVLPVQRCGMSLWGVLHHQYLEHAAQRVQSREAAQASCRRLRDQKRLAQAKRKEH
jgi:hypothetical protein